MHRTTIALALALAFAGCGGGDDDDRDRPRPTATPAVERDANGCEPAPEPRPRTVDLKRPNTRLDPSKTYVATVTTNCGTFSITLDVKRAPKTTASFKYLADHKVYDGTTIHRIVPNFVIQGGDPELNGTGGPGYQVVERPPKNLIYARGVVAMAKGAADPPGASGSQFFVVTGSDAAQLEPEYALLGQVTGGESVVESLGGIITDPRTDAPEAPIVIESVRVSES